MLNTFSQALINNIIGTTFKSFQQLKQETMLLSSFDTQMIENLQSITKPIKEQSEKLTQLSQSMMQPMIELQQQIQNSMNYKTTTPILPTINNRPIEITIVVQNNT